MSKEHYQKEREQMFEVYGHECGMCGTDRNLTAHHIVERHDHFMPLGVEKDNRSNLYPVCRGCHDLVEEKVNEIDKRYGQVKERVIYKCKHKKKRR